MGELVRLLAWVKHELDICMTGRAMVIPKVTPHICCMSWCGGLSVLLADHLLVSKFNYQRLNSIRAFR
jgi:hypothetical protein